MRQIETRALFGRAKRYLLKNDGTILRKHKEGNPDYLMSGRLYAYSVVPETNAVDWYTDIEGYIEFCRKNGILKDDEQLDGVEL